jgi:hypothetical protein
MGALFFLLSVGTACSAPQFFSMKSANGTSVAASSQDLRITVIGERQEYNDAGERTVSRTVTCVEPVGPAMLLQSINATGAISALGNTTVNAGGNGSFATDGGLSGQLQGYGATGAMTDIRGNLALQATQQIGQIYQVGEVMQFVQTMSFRYCEAFANGSLTSDEYIAAIDELQDRATQLMTLQMSYQTQTSIQNELVNQAAANEVLSTARTKCKQALPAGIDVAQACASEPAYLAHTKEYLASGQTKTKGAAVATLDEASFTSARAAVVEADGAEQALAASTARIKVLQSLLPAGSQAKLPTTFQAAAEARRARDVTGTVPPPTTILHPVTPLPPLNAHPDGGVPR